jgi:hypothetical protein
VERSVQTPLGQLCQFFGIFSLSKYRSQHQSEVMRGGRGRSATYGRLVVTSESTQF